MPMTKTVSKKDELELKNELEPVQDGVGYRHICFEVDEPGRGFDFADVDPPWVSVPYISLREFILLRRQDEKDKLTLVFDLITVVIEGERLITLVQSIQRESVYLVKKGKSAVSSNPAVSTVCVSRNKKEKS